MNYESLLIHILSKSPTSLRLQWLTAARLAFIESEGGEVKEIEGYFIVVISPCWHLVNTDADNGVSHREI